jgi:hypothetical protein
MMAWPLGEKPLPQLKVTLVPCVWSLVDFAPPGAGLASTGQSALHSRSDPDHWPKVQVRDKDPWPRENPAAQANVCESPCEVDAAELRTALDGTGRSAHDCGPHTMRLVEDQLPAAHDREATPPVTTKPVEQENSTAEPCVTAVESNSALPGTVSDGQSLGEQVGTELLHEPSLQAEDAVDDRV